MAGTCSGCGQMLLLLVAFVFSPIHCFEDDDSSPLIDGKCGDLEHEDVNFGGNYELHSNCGQEVKLDKVSGRDPPSVTLRDAEKGEKYLIAMVDPDAPFVDNPSCRSWLHWIVGNIDGGDLAEGKASGDTFTDYNPPTPPKPKPGKTNDHRYFIYVFKQEEELDSSAKVGKRCRFDISDYKDKFHLTAVAVNMFKTHS